MKDQYFGDKTDYLKHSLLRFLARAGIKLAIHWNRTPDDLSRDGLRLSYLSKPSVWRNYDPDVFDTIKGALTRGVRKLSQFEDAGLIPRAAFCYDLWTSDLGQRKESVLKHLDASRPTDAFFFDPDNGMEVAATFTSKNSLSKYVLFDELALVWDQKVDLLIYQHYPRVNRHNYLLGRFEQLVARLDHLEQAIVLSTGHAAFIYLANGQSHSQIRNVFCEFARNWHPHVELLDAIRTGDESSVVRVKMPTNQGEMEF